MITGPREPLFMPNHTSLVGERNLMSAPHNDTPEPLSKVQRVRLAADTLGISERTVYRRLRSGRLEQLPVEIRNTDAVMSNVSVSVVEDVIASQFASLSEKTACQFDMTNDNLAAIRQELATRDQQVETLLQNQQELLHTIQNLQGQIYELARLALVSTPREVDHAVAVVEESPVRRQGGLIGLLRKLWGDDRQG